MQSAEGKLGRVFMVRLDDGDEMPAALERFAAEKNITHGFVILLGGVGQGRVVAGPRQADERPLQPLLVALEAPHEVAAVGVLAPDAARRPVLHIHGVCGRAGTAFAGCLRPGVTTWLTAEAIIYEMVGVTAVRMPDPVAGVMKLEISPPSAQPAAVAEPSPKTVLAVDAVVAVAPRSSPEALFLFEAEMRR